jgi:hypothetical protein
MKIVLDSNVLLVIVHIMSADDFLDLGSNGDPGDIIRGIT